jgi:hypothetical protein
VIVAITSHRVRTVEGLAKTNHHVASRRASRRPRQRITPSTRHCCYTSPPKRTQSDQTIYDCVVTVAPKRPECGIGLHHNPVNGTPTDVWPPSHVGVHSSGGHTLSVSPLYQPFAGTPHPFGRPQTRGANLLIDSSSGLISPGLAVAVAFNDLAQYRLWLQCPRTSNLRALCYVCASAYPAILVRNFIEAAAASPLPVWMSAQHIVEVEGFRHRHYYSRSALPLVHFLASPTVSAGVPLG